MENLNQTANEMTIKDRYTVSLALHYGDKLAHLVSIQRSISMYRKAPQTEKVIKRLNDLQELFMHAITENIL